MEPAFKYNLVYRNRVVYISGFIEPAFKHNPVYRNRGVYISGFIKPASNTIRYTETGLYSVYISGFIEPASNTIQYTETGLYIRVECGNFFIRQNRSTNQRSGMILEV